jgi:hypothetical protein
MKYAMQLYVTQGVSPPILRRIRSVMCERTHARMGVHARAYCAHPRAHMNYAMQVSVTQGVSPLI